MRLAAFCCLLAALLAAAASAADPSGNAAGEAGLARVPSRAFDEVYRRPDADLSGYKRIVIDAPSVEFRADWLRRMNESRGVARRIEPADARDIAEQLGDRLRSELTQALRAQGYEIVPAASPGVLRLSPAIVDLYVNAPFVPAPGIDVGLVRREAGEATMRLEIRDAATGTLLARMADHDDAQTVGGFERATNVSNLFWFEGLFGRWANDCVRELRAAAPAG
jgi:hypothetical protein